ncbi:MAG: acyl-CoA dehydrogenase family protein [Thermodesulfobacteriota bacterium]|nr:acyl-CoA dehydrogenase family protein [Thermodesulfobacteriota bacterium]
MGYLELDVKIGRKLKALQENAREFGMEVVRPAGVELDRLHDPAEVIAEGSVLWDVFKQFRETGLHKLMIPRAFGGTMGTMPSLAATLLNEQMGYADGGLAISLLVSCMPFAFAIMSPEAEVRNWAREYVEDTGANMVGCWAITEPEHGTDWIMGVSKAGSDPRLAPELTAVKKGDEYILNGQKAAWVSNGTIATHAVLHVGLDQSMGIHGSGIALCPLDLPGISRGAPLNKLGQRPLNQGEIIFKDVKLHKKYMLIPISGFFGANTFGLTFLGMANSSMGATFSGQAQASLDEALTFAKNNTREGLLLAEQEDVKLKLFRMFTRVEAARLFSRKVSDHFFSKTSGPVSSLGSSFRATFWMLGKALQSYYNLYEKHDSVRNFSKRFMNPKKASDLMEWGKYGVASKITATETAYDVAVDAFQIFGEKALSSEYPIGKMLRDARASLIEDGVNDALAMASYEGI